MNWVSSLYSPDFWQALIAKLPPFDEMAEERTLAVIATHAGLSTEIVRARMRAYLRGLGAELRKTIHPGNDAHRGRAGVITSCETGKGWPLLASRRNDDAY
jgi:hypothetical protein